MDFLTSINMTNFSGRLFQCGAHRLKLSEWGRDALLMPF